MSDNRWMAYSDRVMNHMTWRATYARGYRKARYPLPVIPIEAKWYPKATAGNTLCVINRIYADKWCTYTGWWSEDT